MNKIECVSCWDCGTTDVQISEKGINPLEDKYYCNYCQRIVPVLMRIVEK